MKMLDPLAFIVTHSLARLGAPVPLQTHPVPSILKQNSAAGCRPIVRLVESAFPIVTIPGFWEMLRKLRSEQSDRELSSDVNFEDCNHFVQRDRGWDYAIVPWED
jgi:hypothetical protein